MNSVQESKQELEAAIRYAENAISSAKQTIESMEFRQEMAKKQSFEKTGREAELERELQRQQDLSQGYYDTMMTFKAEVEKLRKEKEASSGPCGCQAYRDLEEKKSLAEHDATVKTAQAEAWKKKYYDFKEALVQAGDPRVVEGVSGVIMDKPTMPVIPKAVAIAIFREGVAHGVSSACDELDNDAGITIEETGYTGDFEVSFNRWIDLSDHLDLDWMRDKVGDYDEASVIEALKTLCADNKFECRIHGIDDND